MAFRVFEVSSFYTFYTVISLFVLSIFHKTLHGNYFDSSSLYLKANNKHILSLWWFQFTSVLMQAVFRISKFILHFRVFYIYSNCL